MRHLWFNFAPIKEIIIMKTIKSKTLQSPEGVALLMENMWLRHKVGMKKRSDNVFFHFQSIKIICQENFVRILGQKKDVRRLAMLWQLN